MSDSVQPQRRQSTRLPRPWDSPDKNIGVCCHFLLQCMKVKSESEVAQSCPTLGNALDYSPEKAMTPHSSTLAWKIPWTEEPARLQSMGSLKSDTTEQLHFHFSLSCIGEGNGNPLQCSCLENPRDGGAWWTAVSGVAQSQTQLK